MGDFYAIGFADTLDSGESVIKTGEIAVDWGVTLDNASKIPAGAASVEDFEYWHDTTVNVYRLVLVDSLKNVIEQANA